MVDFVAIPSATPAPGLVLRLSGSEPTYLRITHRFNTCVYAMWVSEAKLAHDARRPQRLLLHELAELANATGSEWGRIVLPDAFKNIPDPKSDPDIRLQAIWKLVEPLLAQFSIEKNLTRGMFTRLIRDHAKVKLVSPVSLRRWVLRYYYFGGSRLALLDLPSGPHGIVSATTDLHADDLTTPAPRRRGPKSALSNELGECDFVVQKEDINDMRDAMRRLRGKATQTGAHESYLGKEFRDRHPERYAAYTRGEQQIPVTLRQFRYYIRGAETSISNSPGYPSVPGVYTAALYASGAGEITEIDSATGRLFLRQKGQPEICLGQPTIYLAIDRWSRYVLSVYMSLAPPSYEELRYTLLIAFTSRTRRFTALDIDIDDIRWPPGILSACICVDRGCEFLSESAQQSIVDDLRIELSVLPPGCPDGKAIVERLIGVLKKRMASEGMRGAYADRPRDRTSRKAVAAARSASIYSLADAYRAVIEIIQDHNNRSHSALERYEILAEAGVAPTPQAAYLWGLKHQTGRHSPPYLDDDYYQMLLSKDMATLSNRALVYRNRVYRPVDSLAWDLIKKSTTRAKRLSVRVDKTEPSRIFVPNKRHAWATFEMTLGALQELHGVTLEEEDARTHIKLQLKASAEHDAQRQRIIRYTDNSKHGTKSISPHIEDARTQQITRTDETERLKRQLSGRSDQHKKPERSSRAQSINDWQKVELDERRKKVDLIRMNRNQK